MNKNVAILLFVACVVSSVAAYLMGQRSAMSVQAAPSEVVHFDTIRQTDTVFVRHDTLITRCIVRHDTISDSIEKIVTVEVPIYRTSFDTVADNVRVTGYLDGYHAAIAELSVELPTAERVSPKNMGKWTMGISAGYGVTVKGLAPYVGISVNYKILDLW